MKRINLVLIAALILLLSPLSLAASPDGSTALEKARLSFRQGVHLYNEGSFEAALAEFRKAYQLSPNYRLLYNIALTYFDIHDYVSSIKNLKQYVQEGGSDLTPERRRQVSELTQKLEERIASIEIDCNIDGADIRVDDMYVGVSPLSFPVLVNAGPRRIIAVKPGYSVAARLVTVGGKEKARVSLEIAPLAKDAVADRGRGASVGTNALSPAPKPPVRVALVTAGVVAGGCAIATSVFGLLALDAKNNFNNELLRIPNTKDNVDSARSKMKTYAHLTDAFGAAALVSGGVALYLLLSDSNPKATTEKKSTVAFSPTLGGVSLHGAW
jgi:tetratricopeptide (TPR) repeat protein